MYGMNVTTAGLTYPDSGIGLNMDVAVTANPSGYHRALTWDASASNKMKLAGDGDVIRAALFSLENRQSESMRVGTARFRGGFTFKVKTGNTVNIGDSVVGAGDGEVKAAPALVLPSVLADITKNAKTTQAMATNYVSEVDSSAGTVTVVFL